MPVTINGTTGIAGVDGSAGTPAVQGSDTNTGIYFPDADTVAVSVGGTDAFRATPGGNMSITGTMAMGSSFLRNRIINGDMRIDQRNAGASVTPSSGVYTLDRWASNQTTASKFSVQQQTAVVPVGFSHALKVTSLSAYSIAAGDIFGIYQPIEGFNFSDFAFGTASAQSITLSFWVYSSLTGTFGGSLINGAANRSYLFPYSIASANTWTKISVTIPGDTTGSWSSVTNGVGAYVAFGFGTGTTNSGTANSWNAGLFYAPTGAVSVVGTNAATWYITGVQLEAGSVATPFERRQYGQELALCQRYYQITGHTMTTTSQYSTVRLGVNMRSAPTIGTVTFDAGTGATFNVMNVTSAVQQTNLYQNTNHSQIAQASIPLSAEL